jgi:hypothetical protein
MAGLLDHSTNTIILDAVLTTRGRELLSRFDGSFQITKFALTDDEIQYNLIRQYGRIIGKEYIEKLTPVVEAQTNAAATCKFHLISASDQRLDQIPTLAGKGNNYNAATKTLTFTTARQDMSQPLTVFQELIGTQQTISPDLQDSVFIAKMRHDQFMLIGASAPTIGSDGIAEYRLLATSVNPSTGAGSVSTTIQISPQLASAGNYGADRGGAAVGQSGDPNTARGFVKFKGLQSGAALTVTCIVNKR